MAKIKVIHPTTGELLELPVIDTYELPYNSFSFEKYYRVSIDDMPTDWPGYDDAFTAGATHYDFPAMEVEEGFDHG